MEEIIIDDIVITIIRKKIKNLYIKVRSHNDPKRCIQISAPVNSGNNFIRAFINSKLEWIKKHHIIISEKNSSKHQYQYESGELHEFQGKQYLLNVIYGRGSNKVIKDDLNLVINLYVINSGRLLLRKMILQQWYKKELDMRIFELIEKWQNIIGVRITEYNIRHMTSRWGSCNITNRKICLNLELIKKPQTCLEYIVVHELIHLLERKHNKRFYVFMDKFLPRWREIDRML